MDLSRIEHGLDAVGMSLRGAFHPVAEDRVPEPVPGRRAGTVVLAGNVGQGMWAAFSRNRSRAGTDPLDEWTRSVLSPLAEGFGGRAVYPFDGPPYLPFQEWALRAGTVFQSPMGPLVHPEYGLWHAYRGAIVLVERIALPEQPAIASPCQACEATPCLATCPVGALGPDGYDVDRCVEHVASRAGTDCRERGCLARRACPVGRAYTYNDEQARFHMAAFLRARHASE